jgi:type I restriction enzyme S subunit
MVHMTKSGMEAWAVDIPPLAEQRRIAAILDQADALRRARRRAIERLNDLGQAIFYEMFGDLLSEDCTAKSTLSDILDFSNGVNFSADQKSDNGVLVLDVLNMYSDTIYPDLHDLYRVSGVRNIEKRYLHEGDLLFVRSSLKEEGVGWPALFAGHSEPVAFCGFIIRGRPFTGAKAFNPHFLVHYLRLPSVRKKMISSSGKVAITNINQVRLGQIQVPYPPPERQVEFSLRIKEAEKLMINHRRHLASLDTLFSSLQQRAFRGNL